MIGEPLSMGMPATQTLSLIATRLPASGPSSAPGIEHTHDHPFDGLSAPVGRWPRSARGYFTGRCSSGSSSSRAKPASAPGAAAANVSSSSSVSSKLKARASCCSLVREGGWTGTATSCGGWGTGGSTVVRPPCRGQVAKRSPTDARLTPRAARFTFAMSWMANVRLVHNPSSRSSAEGEDVRPRARAVEGDLEGPLGGAGAQAHELVHARLVERAGAGGVGVDAVVVAGRIPVEADREADRAARLGRREHEVDVARQEAVRDRAARLLRHGGLLTDEPPPVERPLVQREVRSARGRATLAARAAQVGLGRAERVPVSGLGHPAGVDLRRVLLDAEQLLDRRLDLAVAALAEAPEPDLPVAIDEVQRGPVVVVERPPDREVVV